MNQIKSIQEANENQLACIEAIQGNVVNGEFELFGYFNGDVGSPMSIWVSEYLEEDLNEEELNDDIIYYGISVNTAIECMLLGSEIMDSFTVLGVNGISKEKFLSL